MYGIIWFFYVWCDWYFLLVITYRILAIIKLPVHLRWELAPIPHEKGKGQYGRPHIDIIQILQKPITME